MIRPTLHLGTLLTLLTMAGTAAAGAGHSTTTSATTANPDTVLAPAIAVALLTFTLGFVVYKFISDDGYENDLEEEIEDIIGEDD